MATPFDTWWDASEKQFMADACHMSEYHMASVVWKAATAWANALHPSGADKESDDVVFAYEGDAYNRPVGRGVVIGDKYLEDAIPEGEFHIRVLVTNKTPNVELTGAGTASG